MPRAFCGCSRAWNYIFLGPPPLPFLPRWRVQSQPVSSRARARSTNMWLLPVSAGSLANGKWYMAARLRTKSLSLTCTHTPPPLTFICADTVTHIWSSLQPVTVSREAYSFRSAVNTNGTKHHTNQTTALCDASVLLWKASEHFPVTHFNFIFMALSLFKV